MVTMKEAIRLDNQYFIDATIYNCPFCNRRHVGYATLGRETFDWSKDKTCTIWRVKCNSCQLTSMHLTFEELQDQTTRLPKFRSEVDLDEAFFISVPTSFFVIDRRIPRSLRELITEAESCAKMNLMTGASACARKAMFELFSIQEIDASGYDSRVSALSAKFPDVDAELFEVLGQLQGMPKEQVREQSSSPLDTRNLHIILEALKTALHEMYVVPDERVSRVSAVKTLRAQLAQGVPPSEKPVGGGTTGAPPTPA
jgi:hypothetical protein